MNKIFAIQSESLRYSLRLSFLSLLLTFGLHAFLFSNILSPLDEPPADFLVSDFNIGANDNCTITEDLVFSFSHIYINNEKDQPIVNGLQLKLLSTPVLECSDVEVCNSDSSTCSAMVQLRPIVSSDCTPTNGLSIQYKIDLDSDGVFDELGYSTNQGPVYPFPNPNNLPVESFLANFPQADGTYPVGSHLIYWEVLDSCGVQASCQQTFVVKDCTPPIAKCDTGIVFIPLIQWFGIPSFRLEASDFNQQSEDNCTASEDLIFSFSTDSTDQVDTLYCFSGISGVLVAKEIYVWDEAGNYSICSVNLLFEPCFSEPPFPHIQGEILTEEGNKVMLPILAKFRQGNWGAPSEKIIIDGEIDYEHLIYQDNTELELYKNDNARNGVTTFDLILINKHILNISPLNSPYKIIAGDVNHSGTITTFDILEIRKMILGVNDTFSSNTSWRFVLEDYVFSNPQNPFQDPFPEIYLNPSLEEDAEVNFIAIKTGDVNNSAGLSLQANLSDRSAAKPVSILLEDQYLKAGETYTIPLNLEKGAAFYGMQFEIEAKESAIELMTLESTTLKIGEEHFRGDARGDLRFSWNSAEPVEGGGLLDLKLRAKRAGWLSDILRIDEKEMAAEIYMENEAGRLIAYPLDIQFEKPGMTTSMSQCAQDTIPPNIICDNLEIHTVPCWFDDPCDPATLGFHFLASDFDLGSTDNCTASGDLIFTFSSDPTDTLNPHNVWENGLFTKEIHVWDEAGNSSSCTIEYALNFCEPYGFFTIRGEVLTEDQEPISSFRTTLNSSSCSYLDTINTGVFDHYLFNSEHEFQIEKNDHHKNGVSTFDLITISRHILGIDTLDSPYKRIAADINRSGVISGLDMLFLRRLILDLDTTFSNNTSWRFLRSSYDFPNPELPFGAPFAEPDTLGGDYYLLYIEEDYIGIKIGDVTGNADPNAFTHSETRDNNPQLHLITPDQQLQAGQTYQLPIYAKTDHRLLGFQFTLDLVPEALTITNIRPGQLETLNREHFGWKNAAAGLLTASWHQAEGIDLNPEPLFYLEVICQQNCTLSDVMDLHSEQIAAEIYTQEKEDKQIEATLLSLQFQKVSKTTDTAIVYPNPTTDWVNIQSDEPIAEIELFSINGQKIKYWQSVNNISAINISELPTGLYLLRLSTTKEKTTHLKLQKM